MSLGQSNVTDMDNAITSPSPLVTDSFGMRFRDGACGRPCPLCNSEDTYSHVSARHMFHGERMTHYARCASCECLFLLDPPEDEDTYTFSRLPADERAAQLKHYVEIGAGPDLMARAILNADLRQVRSFADVGGGVGFSVDFVNRITGGRVRGVCFEPNPRGPVEGLFAEVLPVFLDDAWLRRSRQRFDLILSVEVIEHVEAPALFLAHLGNALADTGSYFILTTPDAAQIAPGANRANAYFELFPGVHKILYSRQAIRRTLLGAGFAGLRFVEGYGRIVLCATQDALSPQRPETTGRDLTYPLAYLEYLRGVVSERGAWDSAPYTAGQAYRLFKEELNRGRLDVAEKLLQESAALRRCIRPGSLTIDPVWIRTALEQPDFTSYVNRCPSFLGPLAFRVALLDCQRSGMTEQSRGTLQQACLLLENERRLSLHLFCEASTLIPVCLRELAIHSAYLDHDDTYVKCWDRSIIHPDSEACAPEPATLEELVCLLRIITILNTRGHFLRAAPAIQRLLSGRYDAQPLLSRDGSLNLQHLPPEYRKLCCDYLASMIHHELDRETGRGSMIGSLVQQLTGIVREISDEDTLRYASAALRAAEQTSTHTRDRAIPEVDPGGAGGSLSAMLRTAFSGGSPSDSSSGGPLLGDDHIGPFERAARRMLFALSLDRSRLDRRLRSLLRRVREVIDRVRPELVFALLALAGGSCLVCVTGPFQAPDEPAHFRRAYLVSEGQGSAVRRGRGVGGMLPREVVSIHRRFDGVAYHPQTRVDPRIVRNALGETFDPRDKVFDTVATAQHSTILYLPQAVGIIVGRWCGLSALELMYCGRAANLLCWVALLCVAIRVTPVFKWVFLATALLPMSLFLAASVSADAMTNAQAMLLTAAVLRASLLEGTIGRLERTALIVLCALVSQAKLAYGPLTGLVFLIPAQRLGGARSKVLFCASAVGAGLVSTGMWCWLIRGLYVPVHGANAPEQIAMLLDRPWAFPGIVANSLVTQWLGYVYSFVGVLGWLDTWLPQWTYRTCLVVLPGLALLDKGQGRPLGARGRVLIGALCALGFLLVCVSQYLTWTKPGAPVIEGVSGRYLLPLAAPALLILYNRRIRFLDGWVVPILAIVHSLAVVVTTCLTVHARYYGPLP